MTVNKVKQIIFKSLREDDRSKIENFIFLPWRCMVDNSNFSWSFKARHQKLPIDYKYTCMVYLSSTLPKECNESIPVLWYWILKDIQDHYFWWQKLQLVKIQNNFIALPLAWHLTKNHRYGQCLFIYLHLFVHLVH